MRLAAEAVRDATAGDYVELRGVLRAADPIVGPVSNESLIGYTLLCSVFDPQYLERVDLAEWSEVVLEDDSGDVPLALEGAVVRLPALAETTLEGPSEIAEVLKKVDSTSAERITALLAQNDATTNGKQHEQLQLLERGVLDGARVSLTGRVADPALTGSAYRQSARPRKHVTGVRGAPLVITPV